MRAQILAAAHKIFFSAPAVLVSDYLDTDENQLDKFIQIDEIETHAFELRIAYRRIQEICQDKEEISSFALGESIEKLAEMATALASLKAFVMIARDRIERSRAMVQARQKGRNEGPQARRRNLIVRLYAQRRLEWDNANQAASALLGEAISIARGVGFPLAEDRAKKTIHEWFLEYDKAQPRNQ